MPKENKHICIISPSLKIGGIERALTVLANYFVSEGYRITFISCLSGNAFYEIDKRINLLEPGFYRKSSRLNKLIFYLRVALFIRKKVKKADPDVVLTFGDWFNPLVLFSLSGLKYPVYISDRTSPDYAFGLFINLAKKIFYPRSAGFIAQTRRSAEYKKKHFGDKLNIRIIPNAIREVKHHNIPREKIILYVGRFAWEKAPERLIKAYSMIDVTDGWRLLMAGSGPMLEAMKSLSVELGIADRVEFPGSVDNVDLLYARAGIYVLPSVIEGFPNSLCEAMAAGLPCVCFDSIAWEDIFIQNESGIAIQKDSIEELSGKLASLILHPAERQRLGLHALEKSKEFNVSSIGLQVLDFITEKA